MVSIKYISLHYTLNSQLIIIIIVIANVAYTEKTYTVNYLFKYLYKGDRKLLAMIFSKSEAIPRPISNSTFVPTELITDDNEYNLFLKARKICSMVYVTIDFYNYYLSYL
jgi:hypothetical protein